MTVAKLNKPYTIGDKGWNITIQNPSKDIRTDIRGLLGAATTYKQMNLDSPDIQAFGAARPFLQSDDDDFVMIEFWTDDESLIIAAKDAMANYCGIKIIDSN